LLNNVKNPNNYWIIEVCFTRKYHFSLSGFEMTKINHTVVEMVIVEVQSKRSAVRSFNVVGF